MRSIGTATAPEWSRTMRSSFRGLSEFVRGVVEMKENAGPALRRGSSASGAMVKAPLPSDDQRQASSVPARRVSTTTSSATMKDE